MSGVGFVRLARKGCPAVLAVTASFAFPGLEERPPVPAVTGYKAVAHGLPGRPPEPGRDRTAPPTWPRKGG